MKRQVAFVLAAGLLMSGTAFAAVPQAADAASGPHGASLKHEVAQVHQKVESQKQKTEQLRKQVETLQEQNRADQQRIEQNDRTIEHLRQQLKQLGVKDPDAPETH